jgi:hypothetical protein
LHIILTSLGNPTKRIFRIQSLKNKRSALHPQVPGTTPFPNSEEKHEMAIFRLSVPPIPDGRNQTFDSKEKHWGENYFSTAAVSSGCLWKPATKGFISIQFADLDALAHSCLRLYSRGLLLTADKVRPGHEIYNSSAAGRVRLASLEEDAAAKRFLLIARSAANLQKSRN